MGGDVQALPLGTSASGSGRRSRPRWRIGWRPPTTSATRRSRIPGRRCARSCARR